jgi:gliding motility-associated-like protein
MQIPNFTELLLITCSLLCTILNANAQCVTAYPYTENFETNNGNWVSGGIGNTWAWGTPAKPIINTAGSGVKCWITDGLTGTGYASCERSWVESPCFNFTTVPNPVVAFKIYWECENNFDGATFQYSINSGTTWSNVGAFNDPINCMTGNWFTNNNITHLSNSGTCTSSLATVKHGWAGNSGSTVGSCLGGGGSNGWVVAKHCLAGLGGLANVKFRFAFGAGSNCNNYDGFAFDSVSIYNAPPTTAAFTWQCNGANSVSFTNASLQCPSTYAWNFGDPTSANNTSALANPSHLFTAAGTYTVTLTSSGPCNGSNSTTQIINIPGATQVVTQALCNGAANGSVAIIATTSNAPNTFALTGGAANNTTGVFANLTNGVYTYTVTDAKNCTKTGVFSITQPNAISAAILNTSTTKVCLGQNTGTISANATGGNGALGYTLQPNNITNTSGVFTNLGANVYTIVVKDANNCTKTLLHTITASPAITINNWLVNSPDCPTNSSGSIFVTAFGGSGNLQYTLSPTGTTQSSGSFNGLMAATYTITIKDAINCSVSSIATITTAPTINFSYAIVTDIKCFGDPNGALVVNANGGSGSLTYTLLPNNITQSIGNFNNLTAGQYTVQMTDSKNCKKDTLLSVNLLSPQMLTSFTKSDVGCVGLNNDGKATINIVGGAAPFAYTWGTNPIQTTQTATNLFGQTYFVKVVDAYNCSTIDSVSIAPATCCQSIFFPNIFTPNRDNVNDEFYAYSYINLDLKAFEVYNRFGQKVWQTNNLSGRWDGSYRNADCEIGTYYYYFRYRCLEDNKEYILRGDLVLTR